MGELPPFAAFYRAVNRGCDPFPWQARLAQQVVREGWPTEIGVPTGLGKTACIDIAVWSLAVDAARGVQRRLPTRIWYVVNRRLLVDAAWERGKRLAGYLADPQSVLRSWPLAGEADVDAVSAVADALRAMAAFGSRGPLHLTRLRGSAELGARVPDPSQPALISATVPMFASRWLFRGYASSASMRPVDAALAGIDSLVLLDEAHLSRSLMRLSRPSGAVALCDAGDPASVLPESRSRPVFVALTATGEGEDRFDLDEEDFEHPVVRQRLHARKLVSASKEPAKELPNHLEGLTRQG